MDFKIESVLPIFNKKILAMTLNIYQVDAFVGEGMRGNPAAIVPLREWLEDEVMQEIAEENNLSETAFFVKEGGVFRLRWFTPTTEVNLCGHATLAAAFVLFNCLDYKEEEVSFVTKSGILSVKREGGLISMDFPSEKPFPCESPIGLADALGMPFKECLKGVFYLVLYRRAEDVVNLNPDFSLLGKLNINVIATAKGDNCDFVSRVFAPASGINEDAVTGSAHTILIPFWSKRLERHKLLAKNVSSRGGLLTCVDKGDRVEIKGKARLFLKGEIYLN